MVYEDSNFIFWSCTLGGWQCREININMITCLNIDMFILVDDVGVCPDVTHILSYPSTSSHILPHLVTSSHIPPDHSIISHIQSYSSTSSYTLSHPPISMSFHILSHHYVLPPHPISLHILSYPHTSSSILSHSLNCPHFLQTIFHISNR